MATKSNSKTGISKVAEKIASIAGTLAGKKNLLVKKASIAIDTVKSKVHDLTAPKKPVKKAVKKAKTATKKIVKKVAGKASAAKKKGATVTRKVKKAAKN
jgi:hypothetical protein